MLSSGNKTANIYVKNCSVYLTFCKGDTVVRDIKQQRSIFHYYKISNFSVTHSQKKPTDNVKRSSWKFCNSEKLITASSQQVAEEQRSDDSLKGCFKLAKQGKGGFELYDNLLYHRKNVAGDSFLPRDALCA